MARHLRASGVTLIEAMIAMAVLVVGSMGLVGLYRVGVKMNSDARVIVRATVLAQDLLSQMQTWSFTSDPRLVNTTTTNDVDIGDSAFLYEQPVGSFTFDHQESELEAQGVNYPWLGVSSAAATELGFTRYWNIAEVDYDQNGVLNGRRVAAIVRWQKDNVARRVVLIGYVPNPSNTN